MYTSCYTHGSAWSISAKILASFMPRAHLFCILRKKNKFKLYVYARVAHVTETCAHRLLLVYFL